MKNLKNMKKRCIALKIRVALIFCVLLSPLGLLAQTSYDYCFSIYDAAVVCGDSSYTYIPSHLITNDGLGNIDLDGKIVLQGNLINNSSGYLFNNIEGVPNGNLFMANLSGLQAIKGTAPTHFENLILTGFEKNLQTTDCALQGILTLDARFNLNENNFIIDTKDPGSINYVSGHIHSESYPPVYGTIQWNIGDALGNYSIPFGSGANNSNDVNLFYSSISPGDAFGNVKFATYHTPDFTNYPIPSGVSTLSPYNDMNLVDRFWIIEPNYSNKPEITLAFKYNFMDVDNPNKIKQPTLKAIRFNSNSLSWNDWTPSSNADADNMLVTTGSIPKQYFFTNWTLASEDVAGDIWIPNAFTPDRDENYTNEDFGPLITFQYARYEFYIYDRWGELVFQSENINNRWDGTYLNSVVKGDIFTWLIVITKDSGKKYKYTGTVNVIL